MSIGISQTFPMDFDLIARLLAFYGAQPRSSYAEISRGVGLNKRKIEGLNSLMKYLGIQDGRSLTQLGSLILRYDKYLQDIGTLCVMHYLLSSNPKAEIWFFASNQFVPHHREFTSQEFRSEIDYADIGSGNTRLKGDIGLFLNAYVSDEYQALQKTNYLKVHENIYQTYPVDRLPPLVLGYLLYYHRMQHAKTSTFAIDSLLSDDGNVGKVFLLSKEALLRKLRVLEAKGIIGINQIADLDNVTFTDIKEPLNLLENYYQGQE